MIDVTKHCSKISFRVGFSTKNNHEQRNVHRCNLFRKIKEYVCKIGRIFMIEFCQKHNSGNEFILQNYGKLIIIFENSDMN